MIKYNEFCKAPNQLIHEILFPFTDQFASSADPSSPFSIQNMKHRLIKNAFGREQHLMLTKIKNLYHIKQCAVS